MTVMTKYIGKLVLATSICFAMPTVLLADSQANIDWGITTFFKLLNEGGLDKVQETVRQAYEDYDARPNRNKLERIVTIDMAANLFLLNLPDGVKKITIYDYWRDENVIDRVSKKASTIIESENERGAFMLSWRKRTMDAMSVYYQQHTGGK
jgi:hypothetical protein